MKFLFIDLHPLSNDEIRDLEKRMTERRHKIGDVLYKVGDEHNGNIYFVISGLIKINIKHHSEIKKYGMGEIVGLECLFDMSDHITTAIVDTDCVLLEVPINYF